MLISIPKDYLKDKLYTYKIMYSRLTKEEEWLFENEDYEL